MSEIDEKALKAAAKAFVDCYDRNGKYDEYEMSEAIIKAYEAAKTSGQPDEIPENDLRDLLWESLMDKGEDTVSQVDCAFEVLKPYIKGVKWNS